MQGASDTNLEVITDAHHYAFLLSPLSGPDDAAYVVRFLYPPATQVPDGAVVAMDSTYKLSGARSLWPIAIADDGRSTSIRWAPETALPAVFAEDARGQEALVTGRMTGDNLVIDGVAPHYIFRLGRDEATASRLPKRRKP